MTPSSSEIALWALPLDAPADPAVLAPEELAWADSAVEPVQRRRRICGRAWLRRVLGAYVSAAPAALIIERGAHGKPRLRNGPSFNLSHADGLMLLAVGGAELGVDVERCGRLDADWPTVARGVFSDREQAALAAEPEPRRAHAALRVWVRKEAYAKARGVGFAYGFRSFTVDVGDSGPGSSLLEDLKDPGARDGWRVADVAAPAGFMASLAYSGPEARITTRCTSEIDP